MNKEKRGMKKEKIIKRRGLFLLCALLSVLCYLIIGCQILDSDVSPEKGSINGKALFNNSDIHGDITVTLEKIEGARPVSTRSMADQTTTVVDGSYSFSNLNAGMYTIYASSNHSKERAVSIGVNLAVGQSVTAEDLFLTAVGSIKGKITLEAGTPTDLFGFLVSVAGTSYMAITDRSRALKGTLPV